MDAGAVAVVHLVDADASEDMIGSFVGYPAMCGNRQFGERVTLRPSFVTCDACLTEADARVQAERESAYCAEGSY